MFTEIYTGGGIGVECGVGNYLFFRGEISCGDVL